MPFNQEQEARIKDLSKQLLAEYLKSDRFLLQTTLQMLDGRNIQLGRGTGTKIGLSALEKIGFYGTAPVAQQTGVAVSAAGVHAALVALGLITA